MTETLNPFELPPAEVKRLTRDANRRAKSKSDEWFEWRVVLTFLHLRFPSHTMTRDEAHQTLKTMTELFPSLEMLAAVELDLRAAREISDSPRIE